MAKVMLMQKLHTRVKSVQAILAEWDSGNRGDIANYKQEAGKLSTLLVSVQEKSGQLQSQLGVADVAIIAQADKLKVRFDRIIKVIN